MVQYLCLQVNLQIQARPIGGQRLQYNSTVDCFRKIVSQQVTMTKAGRPQGNLGGRDGHGDHADRSAFYLLYVICRPCWFFVQFFPTGKSPAQSDIGHGEMSCRILSDHHYTSHTGTNGPLM